MHARITTRPRDRILAPPSSLLRLYLGETFFCGCVAAPPYVGVGPHPQVERGRMRWEQDD